MHDASVDPQEYVPTHNPVQRWVPLAAGDDLESPGARTDPCSGSAPCGVLQLAT